MTRTRMCQEYPVSLVKLSFFFIQVKNIQVLDFDNWHPLMLLSLSFLKITTQASNFPLSVCQNIPSTILANITKSHSPYPVKMIKVSLKGFRKISFVNFKTSSFRHCNDVYCSRKISFYCIYTCNVLCISRTDFFKRWTKSLNLM